MCEYYGYPFPREPEEHAHRVVEWWAIEHIMGRQLKLDVDAHEIKLLPPPRKSKWLRSCIERKPYMVHGQAILPHYNKGWYKCNDNGYWSSENDRKRPE